MRDACHGLVHDHRRIGQFCIARSALNRTLEVGDQVLGTRRSRNDLDEFPPVGSPLIEDGFRRMREQRNRGVFPFSPEFILPAIWGRT